MHSPFNICLISCCLSLTCIVQPDQFVITVIHIKRSCPSIVHTCRELSSHKTQRSHFCYKFITHIIIKASYLMSPCLISSFHSLYTGSELPETEQNRTAHTFSFYFLRFTHTPQTRPRLSELSALTRRLDLSLYSQLEPPSANTYCCEEVLRSLQTLGT